LLAQIFGEFTDGGGFAGALQTCHQDDRRRLRGEIQLRCFRAEIAAHQCGQFALHHADQRLSWRQRTDHIFAHCFFFDAGDKFAHRRQRDVGFEQGEAYFAQHVCRVGFGQARFAAHGFNGFG
jgi:hypothetical protein